MGEDRLILILGGARSGKSSFAQRLARERGGDAVLFIATAEAGDEEMQSRIAAHRAERPAAWQTLEAPRALAASLEDLIEPPRVVLVDCLTLWVSNVLLADAANAEARLSHELEALLAWRESNQTDLIVVSNEVGLGIVPGNALARGYRDLLGVMNQRVAQHADQVFLMVAGLPVDLKALIK